MRRFDPKPLSRTGGAFRKCDARMRLIAALILLVAISVRQDRLSLGVVAAGLVAGAIAARLDIRQALARYFAILLLPLCFAGLLLLTGGTAPASLLFSRAALSGGVLLLLTGVTPFAELLDAMRRIGVPSLLVETIQFVYRYLFLLVDQGIRMRNAVLCRRGQGSMSAVAGSVGVLFARSYARAEGLHRAMLARNYDGRLPGAIRTHFGPADAALLASALGIALGGPLLDSLRNA